MDREDIHNFIVRMRKLMITDLSYDVVDELFRLGHFTTEEYDYIRSQESREKRIICLLDKLPAKTKAGYSAFVEYLQEWYDWIVNEYKNDLRNESSDNENMIKYLLSEAEVPSLPQKHVSRKDELINLIDYLHKLRRGEYIVVHGMGGCGKSTLVIEALRRSSSLVLDTFNKKIFWLMVGRESAVKKEALNEAKVKELTIQQELYTKLFTSGGYSSPPLPLDNDEGKRRLKEKLSEPEIEDCLLILDDVPSSNFIECLNVGCKILVTTDNKNIMNSVKNTTTIQFLEVAQGFTESESMALFSQNLESEAKLPTQAKHIHALCKGFPLTISLVASQLAEYKDDVLTNTDRWDAYVEHLKNKDIEAAIGRCDEYRQDQITSLYKALAMSINNLTPQLRDFYQDFALFMDDVNIKPEVLITLWKVNKKEVEDIMNEFEKKCLVIRTWNGQLSSYVYCVHDLLLDYLKRRLTLIELQRLHKKLIARYREKFGNNFVDFPCNDNYIYLYLGYHLKEAGYLEEFPKLYFELKFIEKKILIHGAADVLYDFKKYKDYITNTEDNTKKYEELYNFISRIGICRVLSSCDIVQFALAEPKASYVYKMGVNLSKSNDKKYFEYLTEVPKDCSDPDVHPMRGEKITAAIFTSDGNIILANANNLIKVIDIKTHETIRTFQGHDEKINQLVLSNLKLIFLSASEGTSVKIWYLNSEGSYADKPRTPSPSLTQKAWKDSWAQQRISAEKPIAVLAKHHLPITDAKFSSKGLLVATASKDKTVIVWQLAIFNDKSDLTLRVASNRTFQIKDVVVSCCFSSDEEEVYVICATQNKVVWIYNRRDCNVYAYCNVDFMINSIALIPALSGIEVILLGDNYKALLYEKSEKKLDLKNEGLQYNTLSRRRHDECICAAVSSDGKYIALAPTFYCIVVKEIKTDLEVAKFHETNGKISGISWSYDSKSIMTTYESALFKIWNVPKATDDKIVKLKASVFDAAWIFNDEDPHDPDDPNDRLLVTAALDTKCHINIYHDFKFFKKISKNDICQLCVCPADGHVIYACKDGTVGVLGFEDNLPQDVHKIECYKVVKLRVFSNGTTTATILLVEKTPKKFKLVGWYNDASSGDSNYLGTNVVYIEEDDSVIDFSVCLERASSVFVAKKDHTFHIFDLKTGYDSKSNSSSDNGSDDDDDSVESNEVKFAEFSSSFELMGSVNDCGILVTELKNDKKCVIKFDNPAKPTAIKFSHDDKFIAVGFASGLVRVYDTETKKEMEFQNTSSVFDLTWSSRDNRLLVILDREIASYFISSTGCVPISTIYLSVDKVIMDNSFSRIVTVDNGGHFHVLKHPL